ncbi:MAG: hypothetical protein AAB916_03005 [Patescibacteria group bacterium]
MTPYPTLRDLYRQFTDVLQNGTEQDARKFLVDHFSELPEEVQEAVAFQFFREGLAQAAAHQDGIAELRKEGINAMGRLKEAKRILEDKLKLMELEGNIKS